MKVGCPSCGRSTHIDPDLGDFPTRCHRCQSLLRRPVKKPEGILADDRAPVFEAAELEAGPAISSGGLAGLLTTRPAKGSGKRKREASMSGRSRMDVSTGNVAPADHAPPDARETLLDVARVEARHKAVRRAELRGSHQTLGALGFALLGLIALAAAALGAKSIWPSPKAAHAGVVELSPTEAPDAGAGSHGK